MQKLIALGRCLVALLSFVALASSADTGRVEINQTGTVAGGGFPFVANTPGSHVLTSNLVIGVTDSAAIRVIADDVVIDLNGFALIGPVTCVNSPPTTCMSLGPDGVDGGARNTTVRNGTIVGMTSGVHLTGSGARVEDLNISQGQRGIWTAGSGALVVRNAITNVQLGVQAEGGLVRDNTVHDVGTGLTLGTAGYSNNTIDSAVLPGVSGGLALSLNDCNGISCGPKRRRFFLSLGVFAGDRPLNACGPRFHMASFWEISDPSQLEYDTGRGFVAGDVGAGAPAGGGAFGWVRNGGLGQTSSAFVGSNNCNIWSVVGTGFDFGTIVALTTAWHADPVHRISPWFAAQSPCNTLKKVWCVED